MKEVRIKFQPNIHETTLALITSPMGLCHTAMVKVEQHFIATKVLSKARKLFIQPEDFSYFGRHDFLPDITSHSPLMRLPHILGSLFGLYVMPMPEKCKDDFEWFVTDMREIWGVASDKVD